MTADRIVTATFATNPTLTVLKAGTGNGAVSSGSAGIACAETCVAHSAAYAPGTAVTLTATAADGSTFTGWSGGSCAGTISCTVSLDAARTVTATFTANPPAPSDPGASAALPPVAQAPTAKARVRPKLRTRPKVSGRARVGGTLVCSRGLWSGSPSRYLLTWRRDGKVVVAGGSRYRVRIGDRGHVIRCWVTAGNATGASTVASSAVHVPR
jgi:hypothetical protein